MNEDFPSHPAPPPPLHSKKYMFLPQILDDTLSITPLPYTPLQQQLSRTSTTNLFKSLQHSYLQFQKYQTLFHNILQKYQGLDHQLNLLKQLLHRLIENRTFKKTEIKLFYNPNSEPVEKLAEKLKLLYSKGRKYYHTSQIHSNVENSVERCEKYQQGYLKNYEGGQKALRRVRYERLLEYKRRFDVVSVGAAYCHTTHAFEEEMPEKTVCVVPFYVESLLVRPGKELVGFPSCLLYCPVLFDEDVADYKIAPEYTGELDQYQKDWQSKCLVVEILVNSEPLFHSYLQINYENPKSTLDSIALVRDKVFQFMIMEFLRHVTGTRRSEVYLDGSIPELKYKISIQAIPYPHKQSTRTLEFITTLFSFLKSDRVKDIKSNQLTIKLKSCLQQVLISKILTHSTLYLVSENKSQFTRYFKKTGTGGSITSEELLRTILLHPK